MTVINYTEARNNLKSVLDGVVNDADYTIINRRDADDAVVMSLDYFNALQETLHLLKSSKNVQHLEKSIAQYHDNKVLSLKLIDE
jgi:antitoxin YefM